MNIIALLTDFGTGDGFVGAMKGVIKSINPYVDIVDISHNIEPFNIFQASLVLYSVYKYYPPYTVFIVVVDPGVGTEREPIIVKTTKYIFVLPNNGLLSFVEKEEKIEDIFKIENERFLLKRVSETFHGRDIFSPVAAYISRGVPLDSFGSRLGSDKLIRIEIPEKKIIDGKIIGSIIGFDRFGNAITNIDRVPPKFTATYRNYRINKINKNFLEGDKDKPNLIVGSTGFLEVFLPKSSFKDKFKAEVGEEIVIEERR